MTRLFDQVPAQAPVTGTCQIAFVGEAPSDYERLYGFPLVGPSGRVFSQLLRMAGLADVGGTFKVPTHAKNVASMLRERSSYLITNVFNEQLPHNDVKNWCAPATQAKEWEDYDLPRIGGSGYLLPNHLHHLSRLRVEIEQCKPKIVVTLGPTALWALTGLTDISLCRGTVSPSSLCPGIKVLPTYHPAHILQDWRLFHVAVTDLIKARAESEFPEIRLAKRKIWIRPTLKDLLRWREALLKVSKIAVDIETAKQQITCIGFAPSPEEAFVVPFVNYETSSRSFWPTIEAEVEAWNFVKEICECSIPKIMQNGLYDCYYLIRQAGIWPKNYSEDTRLQHHSLFPELPKSLAFLGATYGNQGPWKTMRNFAREKRDD